MTGRASSATYTAGGAQGDDTFSYRATNASGTANIVTQVLHLSATANVAPSCAGNAGFPETVPGGETSTLAPGCEDDDGDDLGYAKLSEPAHGTLSDAGGTLVYTPAVGYSGPDQFDFKATDGHGGQSGHGHAPRQRRGAGPADLRAQRRDRAAPEHVALGRLRLR